MRNRALGCRQQALLKQLYNYGNTRKIYRTYTLTSLIKRGLIIEVNGKYILTKEGHMKLTLNPKEKRYEEKEEG